MDSGIIDSAERISKTKAKDETGKPELWAKQWRPLVEYSLAREAIAVSESVRGTFAHRNASLTKLQPQSEDRYWCSLNLTPKALANSSPGFALKPWGYNACSFCRNSEDTVLKIKRRS